MKKHLLFVHIPKTAGTSFRLAALKYFGEENTFFDYGKREKETSNLIKKTFYKEDVYAFYREIISMEKMFLSGHFLVNKYAHIFETLNTITFVREPIGQVLSHYNHFKSYNNYKKGFHAFINEEHFQNIQSKYLKGKPLELYGFIGLSEEYDKSIEMINAYYDIDLEVFRSNVNEDKVILENNIDKETILLIQEKNAEDIKMYKNAKKIFDDRVKKYENNEDYTHLFIHEQNEIRVRGFAFAKNFDDPVEIQIYNNNKLLQKIKAKDFRPSFLQNGLPRKGFVGFEYKIEKDKPFTSIKTLQGKKND